MRKLRWDVPEPTASRHRLRDAALAYGFLSALVVLITAVTGGSVVKGVIAGAAVFVAAMVYSAWRWREKPRRREEDEE